MRLGPLTVSMLREYYRPRAADDRHTDLQANGIRLW